MNIVRFINQLIFKKVLEILVVLFLIFLALFLISRKSFQEIFEEISYFKAMNYTQLYTEIHESFYKVHIVNETYTKETFHLIMHIQEDFINPEWIQLNINGTFFSLHDFEKKAENTFLILNDFIVAAEETYTIQIIYKNALFLNADFYLENILRI